MEREGMGQMIDKNIRIAILDDGVSQKACPLAGSYLIDNDLSVVNIKENIVSPYSHGSMCARIVQRYTELDHVDVFSIQILQGDTLRGNIGRLLRALELCLSMDIRLVHLSVGTYAYEDFAKLEKAVQRLLDSDRFLVAAAGNRGTVTYPAYLPGVIGVKCNPEFKGDEYAYCYDPFTRIHFQSSARHKLFVEGQETETPISNSYAAPLVTAKLLSCMKEHADLEKHEILHMLIEDAMSTENAMHTEDVMRTEDAVYMEYAMRGASSADREIYPPVEIPVVILSGFLGSRLSHLMAFLTDCLRRDDYHVRVATNLPDVRPWDENVLPEMKDLDKFTARMAWYFSCEIILLGSTSYIPPDKCGNASLWIYGEERGSVEADGGKKGDVAEDGSERGECGSAVDKREKGIVSTVDGIESDDVQMLWAAGMEDKQVYETMIELLT